MKRVFPVTLKFSLIFLAVLYAGDWALLRVRMAHNTAFGTVQVDQFLSTPLKGNKAEYDYLGTTVRSCARSIFPHAFHAPCWWVEQHRTQWER